MTLPSESELRELIHQIVERTMLGEKPASSPGNANQPGGQPAAKTDPPQPASPAGLTVAIGADHGGYTLKQSLVGYLRELGYSVIDCGTQSTDAVDYPDFAYAVAHLVGEGKAWRGIAIDSAGIGSCMAANKVPGVRAAMCYDRATASNSREHNNANVLTLGAKMISEYQARQIVNIWLTTLFGGDRHARRVDKIMAIEKRYFTSKE